MRFVWVSVLSSCGSFFGVCELLVFILMRML